MSFSASFDGGITRVNNVHSYLWPDPIILFYGVKHSISGFFGDTLYVCMYVCISLILMLMLQVEEGGNPH